MLCIIDKNKELVTPIKEILETLRMQVSVMNNGKLKDVQYKANEAIVSCPHHKDGLESHASCHIALFGNDKYPAGTYHCFSCGASGNIVKFVAECLNTSYRNATEWVLNVSDYDFVQEVRDLSSLSFDYTQKNPYDDIDGITVDELKKYDYIHPYMFKRKLNDFVIEKFEVGYDPKTDSLTFPVYVDGKCLFVARRKTKSKVFLMPDITPKPIYGIDYLKDNDDVIICESVINALTCYVYGKQAIALFGTGSDYQIEQLKKLPQRKVILALDPDSAGNNGAYKIGKALKGRKIVTRYKIPFGKDINDLSKEEFEKLEEIF